LENGERQQLPEVLAFAAELRHWREMAGHSQKKLAGMVGYTASYVSKVEGGTVLASREFAESADQHLQAGRALVRRWREMREALLSVPKARMHHERLSTEDVQSAPGTELVVEHEHAELAYRDGVYRTSVRRQLRNTGTQPVTQYLIRIAVDRYPSDPELSNQFHRESPLTWEEIGLSATCAEEPMTWRIKHDRDAAKEVWLLFENRDGRFPLYPGDTTWINYLYAVSAQKWGQWWTRAVRLPTRRLSMKLILPARLQPQVWGVATSMTADASPFRTPFTREHEDDQLTFTWSTDEPPLHTRYRVEWRFRMPDDGEPS
jgi:transcriptional regulator with XRE-family HTH domain